MIQILYIYLDAKFDLSVSAWFFYAIVQERTCVADLGRQVNFGPFFGKPPPNSIMPSPDNICLCEYHMIFYELYMFVWKQGIGLVQS